MIVENTWTELKTIISTKDLLVQYTDDGSVYAIWVNEGNDVYSTNINIESPASTDQADFEDNYKANANKAISPSYLEDKVFDAEAIRDTVNHNSSECITGEFTAETIFIENSLDQQVTLQLQGARNATWLDVGASFDIAATKNNWKGVSQYFPKYRLQVICGTSPTTGVLDVWIIKSRG